MAKEINDYLVPSIDYFIFRKCSPTWEIIENEIPFYDLTYVIKGRAIYTINGTRHEVKRGDLLCIPRGSVRKAQCVPEDLMNCYSANFQLFDLNGKQADLPLPLISAIGIKSDIIGLFRDISDTWVRRQLGYQTKVRALTLLIICKLYEIILFNTDSDTVDFRVKKAINYISENYENNVSVKELAELVGLNAVYFGALFKSETGILINQYLMRTRINHAQDMLQNGECNVSEAAERCGYSDLSHFRKQFKMVKGYPPSQCLNKMPDSEHNNNY